MKIKNLFLLLFIGVIIGVSSCKKADEKPEIDNSPVINTKTVLLDEIVEQTDWFETEVIKNQEKCFGKVSLNHAIWYWQNYLNLRYAYPELPSNTSDMKQTSISVQLSNGKVSFAELQRVFNEVLAITAEQFKITGKGSAVTKQLQSGYFELVSSDGGNGKATVKYISNIRYDDGNVYQAKNNPFGYGDDWYWGWELGPYDGSPDFTHSSPDATTRIDQQAWAYFANTGGIGLVYMSNLGWSDIYMPGYWSVSYWDMFSIYQPWLDYNKMNANYNLFIDDIQIAIDNVGGNIKVIDFDYWYFGNHNSSFAKHNGRIEYATLLPLTPFIADMREDLFVL